MDTHLAPSPTSVGAPPLAAWQTRHPWRWAIVVALGGTVMTAFSIGYEQARHLTPLAATYTQAVFVALSALVGLAVMWRTKPSLAEYGLRRPRHLDRTLWLVPLALVPVILVASTGIVATPTQVVAYAVLALAVGFNEEIWFRGLLLATLRRLGTRTAIIGGSVIFGALHLSNLFAGRSLLYVTLQFALACLVGLVLAELVTITGSLWIGIVWHLVYDLVALSAGSALTTAALVSLAVLTVVLALYAVWLWRRLPVAEPR